MCDRCFRFFITARPACVRCAHELATRRARRASLGVLVLLAGVYAGVLLVRSAPHRALPFGIGAGIVLVSTLLGLFIAGTGRFRDASLRVEPREPGQLGSDGTDGSVWLARMRRVVATVAPETSAQGTAWIVCVAVLLSALSFPMAFQLPMFVEVELVILVTYLLVAATLTRILYRGTVLEDDHVFIAPQSPLADVDPKAEARPSMLERYMPGGNTDPSGCEPACASGCEEGAFVGIVIIVAMVAVFLLLSLAWVVVEIALPLVFVLAYELVLAAVRHASRDKHDCRGKLAPSLLYGASYAALYLAPVAIATWLLHRAL